MAAATEGGTRSWSIESDSWEAAWMPDESRYTDDYRGLGSGPCLDFILALPIKAKVMGFALGYDWTKCLEDLPNALIYSLFRPEERSEQKDTVAAAEKASGPIVLKAPPEGTIGEKGELLTAGAKKKRAGPQAVPWKKNGRKYFLNLQGTKFTLSANKRTRVVWDIFKFYQGKFVGACEAWKVGTKEERAHMSSMKDKRGEFDREPPEDVRAYCLKECSFMAELAHKLVSAHEHEDVQLPLKSFYGAGSSASAMLLAMGVKEKIFPHPIEMHMAVASAFFGGRFENSVVGAIRGTVYNYDISSAYPYQIYFLPCLEHGRWERGLKGREGRRQIDRVRGALVRYRLNPSNASLKTTQTSWGPFPYRTEEGSICFPSESGGGWVYKDEYLAGERLFPGVEFLESWVFNWDCECKPFQKVPEYYLQRLALGKEAAGIVLKLGLNSCYGKLAQSIGNALFNCWVWAGIITSGCRAQLLNLLGQHKDWSNALMMATDGLGTLERLDAPTPEDTGTFKEVIDRSTGKSNYKPLGGWEEKKSDKGLFLARPGIYFPMDPTEEELGAVRARGVGRGVVFKHWERIVETWERQGMAGTVRVDDVARFCGAKTSVHKSGTDANPRYTRAKGGEGAEPRYGNWIVRHVDMSFHPKPKRECLEADGVHLRLRKMPMDIMSTPYKKVVDDEGRALKAFTEEMCEQPNVDYEAFEPDEMGLGEPDYGQ